jgi:predicted MFS family arabinose efflux permease
MRVLSNYALEIVESHDHSRYLSTLALCMAGPAIVMSPILGALVDWVGFAWVFWLVVACLFAGWIVTQRLAEPRLNGSSGAV